jgi:hypothetical protein
MTGVALTLIAGTRHSVDWDTVAGRRREPRHRIHAPASAVRQPGQVLGLLLSIRPWENQGYVGYSCNWQYRNNRKAVGSLTGSPSCSGGTRATYER